MLAIIAIAMIEVSFAQTISGEIGNNSMRYLMQIEFSWKIKVFFVLSFISGFILKHTKEMTAGDAFLFVIIIISSLTFGSVFADSGVTTGQWLRLTISIPLFFGGFFLNYLYEKGKKSFLTLRVFPQ